MRKDLLIFQKKVVPLSSILKNHSNLYAETNLFIAIHMYVGDADFCSIDR